MGLSNFERCKLAIKAYEEKRYAELKEDIKKVKAFIEKMLTLAFECTSSQARTNYSGLDMY